MQEKESKMSDNLICRFVFLKFVNRDMKNAKKSQISRIERKTTKTAKKFVKSISRFKRIPLHLQVNRIYTLNKAKARYIDIFGAEN